MFSALSFTLKSQRVNAITTLTAMLFFTGTQFGIADEEQMLPTPDVQSQSTDTATTTEPNATAVAQGGSSAQDSQGQGATQFDLNASVTDGLQLSRQGLKSAPKLAPAEQAIPIPQSLASVMPPVPGMEPGAFSAPGVGAQNGQPDGTTIPLRSSTSVTEYGVDWSTWMSQVADRWFFQLKRFESQSPYEFYTDGPAQIEFTCYPNGQVSNIVLRRSCGVPMYDRMQIEALLSAVPLPPFPRGTQRTSYTLCQGWEAHARHLGESDYQPGTFGRDTPMERVQKWD